MSTSNSEADTSKPRTSSDSYPTQRHAGKVGYGPNFKQGASMTDKIVGLTEELHGKIAHKPELVKEGHDRLTGETRRRKALGLEDDDNPFGEHEEAARSSASARSGSSSSSAHKPGSTASSNAGSSVHSNSSTRVKEQAATVAPEGSRSADAQAKGEVVEEQRIIDEGPH